VRRVFIDTTVRQQEFRRDVFLRFPAIPTSFIQIGSAIADRIGDALPAIRKQGRAIERTARDHPATAAAVGLVVVGLVASLLFSRR